MMNPYLDAIKNIEAKHGENAKYILKNAYVQKELEYLLWCQENGKMHENTFRNTIENIDREAEHLLTPATVKVGDGVTVHLWSDAHAATVIKKTKRTVTVQYDKATLDPNFKPEWIPGGFAAHCTNQDEQTYTYERNPDGRVETYYWSNKYCSYGQPGNLRLTKGRREFYDYNF